MKESSVSLRKVSFVFLFIYAITLFVSFYVYTEPMAEYTASRASFCGLLLNNLLASLVLSLGLFSCGVISVISIFINLVLLNFYFVEAIYTKGVVDTLLALLHAPTELLAMVLSLYIGLQGVAFYRSKTKMILLKEYSSFYLRFIVPLVIFSAFVEAFLSKTLGG